MEERFKQKKEQKQEKKVGSTSKTEFSKFGTKNKQKQQQGFSQDFKLNSATNTDFNKKMEFKDVDSAREFEIKSTSDHLKIGFQRVEGTNSGFFFAVTLPENQLAAVLNDEAEPVMKTRTFNGKGRVRTHVVPVGKIGDVAEFTVTDTTTGDTASAKAVTVPLGMQTIWGVLKNLFR